MDYTDLLLKRLAILNDYNCNRISFGVAIERLKDTGLTFEQSRKILKSNKLED